MKGFDTVELNSDKKRNLIAERFLLVGSRSIPGLDITDSTDYDYIGVANEENKQFLINAGFTDVLKSAKYMDIATESLWINSEQNCQVTLKSPEWYYTVVEMWEDFRDNRNFFEKHFWKSSKKYPKEGNQVRDMINSYLLMIKGCK